MTNFAYYDDYEIRITMRREHSTALKYTAAEQRLEPTLLEQNNGLGPLKQRKQVSTILLCYNPTLKPMWSVHREGVHGGTENDRIE